MYGVPQGSVLGPKFYCMYTKPVGDIVRSHSLQYHGYADDSQLYIVIKPTTVWGPVSTKVGACVEEVASWMSENMLKLNQDKTEFIVFTPKHQRLATQHLSVDIGDVTITAAPVVKNLGVFMDKNLVMERQVNAVSKSCYHQIRSIGQIRQFITKDACKILIQALVTSRLDYANSLLFGLPQCLLSRLQRVQNSAARLVTLTRKRDHITPILHDLHWLPTEYRPQYKILLYTYKALNGMAPGYIGDMITRYKPTRQLRSQTRGLLVTPKTRTKTYGVRCFSSAAPLLWNALPNSIKTCSTLSSFKKNVKTYLFKRAYY